LKEYAGKKVYCADVDKFNLYCYLIVDIETDTTKKGPRGPFCLAIIYLTKIVN
jgi:hypothetical protein